MRREHLRDFLINCDLIFIYTVVVNIKHNAYNKFTGNAQIWPKSSALDSWSIVKRP
jgi:hypothetical protein